MSIHTKSKLDLATARLERAVDRLESAVDGERLASSLSASMVRAADEEAAVLAEQLRMARDGYQSLEKATHAVTLRLDGAIERLRSIVET
ncbi:MAG: DUF4164 family protein [Alphaproteobacteria bacterium]|nr:DUF4164 family protein [Alphaproteobacteria bacterium]